MQQILFILFFFCSSAIIAQTDIKGRVLDQQGVAIIGANVFIEGSYLSYETFKKTADVSALSGLTVKLKESVTSLDAVVITAGTFEAGDKARVSVLKPLDIVTTAGAAGDIIGALTTLPGTQTVGEDGRLFVRGGEANETQTFVDGMRVAQPNRYIFNDGRSWSWKNPKMGQTIRYF